MPWWVFLLIAVAGYVTGFLVSGAILSHTFRPSIDRVDLVWSMIAWPLFMPGYGMWRAGLAYVEFLERTLTRRKNSMPKNITTLPRVVNTYKGWENE
jgi:hypothetical protein